MKISQEILDEVALSEKEYKLIVQQLGREPGGMALKDKILNAKQKKGKI
jgi:hypothetical protein